MARLEGTRLILAVRNLRIASDFYLNVLGFSRDFGDESDGWSWLSRDDVRVGLGECMDAVPAQELGDHSYVAYISVDDIDGLYTEFVSRGAFGTYEVDEANHIVTHHVEGELRPNYVGVAYKRRYEVDGERLLLSSANADERWRVVWERVK